jgi:HEPN domain-containing protein
MADKELLDQWNKLAFSDFKAAKSLLKDNELLLAVFHLQQSVEKYLKMYQMAVNNKQPIHIHSLPRLAEDAELLTKLSPDFIDLITKLNPFYISARYPSYKAMLEKQIDPEVIKKYILKTEELILWLKQEMKY